MIKREFKINFKSFIIWLLVLVAMFLLVYLVYPTIISTGNIEMIDEMMKLFPEEIIKAFNMDISSLNSVFGWVKSEGWIFVLLLTGIYSALIGSNILLKEENDKTIEYLSFLPITREKIVFSKIICGISYIFLLTLIFAVFNFICLSFSDNFDIKIMALLSITPLLTSLPIFFLCLFLSTFFHKTRKMIGISLGIIFVSYFLEVISKISDSVNFLKYASIFTLADTRNIILNESIPITMLVISLGISIIFGLLTIYRYNKKELVS